MVNEGVYFNTSEIALHDYTPYTISKFDVGEVVSEDTSSGDRINLVDAIDGIKNGGQIPPSASEMEFYLADGSRFTGKLFGAKVWGEGELVTTGMTGYQESLTDLLRRSSSNITYH